MLIHEDAFKEKNFKNIIKNLNINKIILHHSKKKGIENIEKLLPTSFDQINKVVLSNIVKKNLKQIHLENK